MGEETHCSRSQTLTIDDRNLQADGGEQAWFSQYWEALGQGYIADMVAQNPTADWLNLDPAAYTSRIDQLVTAIDAVDPDLSRFKARGGKLILWAGLADWLITPQNTTAYYKSVVQKMGGQAASDEFVEYYTAPSVGHCGIPGSTGADAVDLVTPMFNWLEKDIKPSATQIVAKRREVDAAGVRQIPVGDPVPARPLCQYPKYPKYLTGDPNAATSFACVMP